MSIISIDPQNQVLIRCPTVVRYLAREYVDKFFEDGTLRLTSFQALWKHADEERRDELEGTSLVEIIAPGLPASLFSSRVVDETYVLCGMAYETWDNPFGHDAGIKIVDTVSFAIAVGNRLPGCLRTMQGPCNYRAEPIHRMLPHAARTLGEADSPSDFETKYAEFERLRQREQFEGLFTKSSRYSSQCEYRILWGCGGQQKEHVMLTCPEAVEFCQPIYKDLAEKDEIAAAPPGSA